MAIYVYGNHRNFKPIYFLSYGNMVIWKSEKSILKP